MDKKIKAKFKIAEFFNIKGRGLVFSGEIIDGEFNIGETIKLGFIDKIVIGKGRQVGNWFLLLALGLLFFGVLADIISMKGMIRLISGNNTR